MPDSFHYAVLEELERHADVLKFQKKKKRFSFKKCFPIGLAAVLVSGMTVAGAEPVREFIFQKRLGIENRPKSQEAILPASAVPRRKRPGYSLVSGGRQNRHLQRGQPFRRADEAFPFPIQLTFSCYARQSFILENSLRNSTSQTKNVWLLFCAKKECGRRDLNPHDIATTGT